MNEKKAIVFFFVVVFFFCFSFYLLLVVVVASSTYVVTYVFLSFVLCFGCVCVFFFSSSFASLTCASVCSYVCDCVCVSFNFHFLLLLLLLLFFSGAFQTLPFLRTLFLLFRFYVVIRGGVFLHFFFTYRTKHVHTCTRTDTDTQTDGRREKSARAPLVLGSTHKTILRFLLLCVIAIIMIGCCCYSLFMGCFLALLINRDRVRYMHTLS